MERAKQAEGRSGQGGLKWEKRREPGEEFVLRFVVCVVDSRSVNVPLAAAHSIGRVAGAELEKGALELDPMSYELVGLATADTATLIAAALSIPSRVARLTMSA